jgi:hypothetical protein
MRQMTAQKDQCNRLLRPLDPDASSRRSFLASSRGDCLYLLKRRLNHRMRRLGRRNAPRRAAITSTRTGNTTVLARGLSMHATHPDRSNSRPWTLHQPNDRLDQRMRALRHRCVDNGQVTLPRDPRTVRHGPVTVKARTPESAAVHRRSFNSVEAIAPRGPRIGHLVQATCREDPSIGPVHRGGTMLRTTHPTAPQD